MRVIALIQLFFIAALLSFPASSLAQSPGEHALTNADIARMVKAGVPESIIVREIQTSKTEFNSAPGGLIELKNHGASEAILGAVLDSRSSSATGQFSPHVRAQSAGSAAHHLPNFQADLKIKSNSLAKVSMTQNHIKVERAGVPFFDLKWKEKPNP